MLSLRLLIMFIWQMEFNYLIYLIIQVLVSGIVYMKLKVITLRKSRIFIPIQYIFAMQKYILITSMIYPTMPQVLIQITTIESVVKVTACTDIETKQIFHAGSYKTKTDKIRTVKCCLTSDSYLFPSLIIISGIFNPVIHVATMKS